MSSRTRESAARDRVAAMRAAQAQAERRRRLMLAGGAVAVVVLLIAGLVVAKVAGVGSDDTTSAKPGAGASDLAGPAVVKAVTGVPAATLDQVGVGAAQAAPRKIQAPALTADGKPKVLYVGAEFCPFCAAERWPVVVALSRFGTWSGLGATTSAHDDVYPDTATLSFHGASYSSDYLAFAGYETTTNTKRNGQYQPLDTLTPADAKTEATYNTKAYVGSDGGIPFLDIAGRYASSGASYNPELLAGKTQAQIARALADPSDPIAKAVDGSANLLTSMLCDVTGQQPADVCTAPGVQTARAALAGQPGS